MSQENVRHINEILASIEALNAQADDLSRDKAPSGVPQVDMPRSMVAEMAERQADIVLLDEIYWKGGAEGDRAVRGAAEAQKSKPKPVMTDDTASDAEFDQMLSALMKDMRRPQPVSSPQPVAEQPPANTDISPRQDSLTDLKADIDDLLSPYLDVPAARAQPVRRPVRDQEAVKPQLKTERPVSKPQAEKRAQGKMPAADSLITAVMTEQMKDDIADFVLQEIKQQISVWIAQNLDKIVEDALRSRKTESRDASRTRSAG